MQHETIADELRDASLRVTAPRVAVLRYLRNHPHSAADDLAVAVRAELGAVSNQAVYDVLRALATAGLVRRIEPAGHPARYEGRTGDNHHHLVCRHCGDVADVDCAVGDTPCLQAADELGYEIDEAEVIYWGLCPDCQAALAAAATVPPITPASV